MTDLKPEHDLEKHKLNAETAQIAWRELQRFFAAGAVIAVGRQLDLVDVAWQLAQDNVSQFQQWIDAGLIAPVADEQAKAWFDDDAAVWSVIVKPWVLVQTARDESEQ